MFHFYIPWKRQKTKGFQGVQKWNIGLKWVDQIKIFATTKISIPTTYMILLNGSFQVLVTIAVILTKC